MQGSPARPAALLVTKCNHFSLRLWYGFPPVDTRASSGGTYTLGLPSHLLPSTDTPGFESILRPGSILLRNLFGQLSIFPRIPGSLLRTLSSSKQVSLTLNQREYGLGNLPVGIQTFGCVNYSFPLKRLRPSTNSNSQNGLLVLD